MPVSQLYSAAVLGVQAYPVSVEVDVCWGMPVFQIVGLPDGAVKESRERVRSAIRNSGFDFPDERITVNLAPADLKKAGSSYDLAIALGILVANGQIEGDFLEQNLLAAELGLDGLLHPVPGVLPVAVLAADAYRLVSGVIVAPENAREAQVVERCRCHSPRSLAEIVASLRRDGSLAIAAVGPELIERDDHPQPDFAEIKGQQAAKRAFEVAAAGGHNLLMVGPPGSGKTMLAKRLPSILPPLLFSEALETTKIHSVAGLLKRGGLVRQRPFRSPHHSISDAGLIGGGSIPRPGEISLAHNGVLFLDELPEFRKSVLEVMRQPLEDGLVTLSRAQISLTFPARSMLIASMNPCPCGHLGDPAHPCTCTLQSIQRYQARISGPLLDRIDLHVEVPAVPWNDLQQTCDAESSALIQQRVSQARQLQHDRFGSCEGIYTNAGMPNKALQMHCQLQPEGQRLMQSVVQRLGLSARAYTRILKVARTIADLEQSRDIGLTHLAEAVQYRALDRRSRGSG